MAQRACIVVGFDGSSNSVAALNCALVEASLRDEGLVLCHVRERSRPNGGRTWTNAAARQLLAHGAEHAHRRLPSVDVTPRLLTGSPARQLLRAATDARMLVVGARGTSTSYDLRLGPVSDHVARHARRAVLVVPGLGNRAATAHRRVVVVGVDGSSSSGAAVRFAFEEALRRGAAVRAIHVFDPCTSPAADLSRKDGRRLRLAAAVMTRELLAKHAARHPGVPMCAEVLPGTPAMTLAAAARGSELLVLGTRKERSAASLTSGVTRSAVLHNATCPVVII